MAVFGLVCAITPARVQTAEAQTVETLPQDGTPPVVEGLRLGDPLGHVLDVLGKPDPSLVPEDPDADVRSLSFRNGGLMVLLSKADGVARLMLNHPAAGALCGLRVGDDVGRMLDAWGVPPAGNADTAEYRMTSWFLVVRIDPATRRIKRLMLVLVGAAAQPIDLPPPAWARARGQTPP